MSNNHYYGGGFYRKTRIGAEFEDEAIVALRAHYGENLVRASDAEDTLEGTDFFLYRIRFDLTTNACKGGKIVWLDKTFELPTTGHRVSVGIRYSNGHFDKSAHKLNVFAEPVMVICVEEDDNSILGGWMANIVSGLKQLFANGLGDYAMDIALDVMDRPEHYGVILA